MGMCIGVRGSSVGASGEGKIVSIACKVIQGKLSTSVWIGSVSHASTPQATRRFEPLALRSKTHSEELHAMKTTGYLAGWLLLMLLSSATAFAQAPAFKVCKSTYALCTTAMCSAIPGSTTEVSCACDVKTGFSLGAQECTNATTAKEGDAIASRYFPIKSFVACSNERQWANCLDAPCTRAVGAASSSANCTCTLAQGSAPYVITTDKYTADTCTSGIISSATVDSVIEVTQYLETSKELPPYDFKVLNVQKRAALPAK
jgi:hypothetical protein